MSFFDHPDFDSHESVTYFSDHRTGLQAIIAVHSTVRGPAAGGCRRWQYASNAAALTDALRLSRGMTYKNAVAGLPFGGGKAVILADKSAPKSPELMHAFGRAVDSLGGRYITAEDVGVSVKDMRDVATVTDYVSGLPNYAGAVGGDPSPWTALGVFLGVKEAVKARLGRDSLRGVRVAIQGVGNVGRYLGSLLHEAGATLLVADVNQANLGMAREVFPFFEVSPSEILASDVDVLAPCALGGVLSAETIPTLRATVVAGAANNQLANDNDGALLGERGVLYAPDYVINAGGIISVAREYLKQGNEDRLRTEVANIAVRLRHLFEKAADSGQSTNSLADDYARSLLAAEPERSAA